MNGLFITFEGGEGTGKSTQIAHLKDSMEKRGHSVFATREPGGEPLAEGIRGLLLNSESQVQPRTELLLFLASRVQTTELVIRPRLAAGKIILCDRYIDSTTVYQGHARGHDLAWVRRLNEFATGGIIPDLTVLLDLDPVIGLTRQSERNRMEAESLAFHIRVREGYLSEAREHPGRFRVVDASRTMAEVQVEVWNHIALLISKAHIE